MRIACALLAFALRLLAIEASDVPHVNTESFAPAISAQIAEAESQAKAHPDDAHLVGTLGMVIQAYDQRTAAAAAYARAVTLEPAKFEWVYLLGKVEFERGEFDLAARNFQNALRLEPSYLPAQLYLAQCLIATADWDAAERLYRNVLTHHPECPQAWYGLGRVQVARGDHSSAIDSFSKACDLYSQYGAAHFALAGELRKARKTSEAAAHFEAYSKNRNREPRLEDPLSEQVRRLNLSSTVRFERAAELEAAGQLDEAIHEHIVILGTDPNNVQAHVNLISLYGRAGDLSQAQQHFDQVIKLDPGRADAWYDDGVLLFNQRQWEKAAQAFGRALEINPHYGEAHNNLGAIHEMQGQPDEAASDFRAAIADRPDYPLARFHLARILVNQKRYDEAAQQLQRALEPEDENTASYTYALAATYARAGNREKALRYYREAHDRASARGQTQLLATIDREMKDLNAQK